MELTDPGFDFSILSEFRQRLVTGKAEERLLNHLMVYCQDQQWLKAGGKQRTDSTHVLARVRDINRLNCVGENIQQGLADKSLLQSQQLVDTAYVSAELLVQSQQLHHVQLVGPARKDQKWQALVGQGYAAADFHVD